MHRVMLGLAAALLALAAGLFAVGCGSGSSSSPTSTGGDSAETQSDYSGDTTSDDMTSEDTSTEATSTDDAYDTTTDAYDTTTDAHDTTTDAYDSTSVADEATSICDDARSALDEIPSDFSSPSEIVAAQVAINDVLSETATRLSDAGADELASAVDAKASAGVDLATAMDAGEFDVQAEQDAYDSASDDVEQAATGAGADSCTELGAV